MDGWKLEVVTDAGTGKVRQVESFNGSEKMGFKEEQSYLGDIISADGRNTKNIQNRIARGTGVICEILNILNTVTLGEHYFYTAMLL